MFMYVLMRLYDGGGGFWVIVISYDVTPRYLCGSESTDDAQ